MKALKIEQVDGETEITVESGTWIFKKITVYRTIGCYVGEFFKWVEMPDKIMVGGTLAFQLDTWKKLK